jgi:DNA-binding MurR/RpiR family transcriptional regulator
MTPEIQLPKVVQTRINRLAQATGRSPATMLRFVLKDGFEAVERSIQENAVADAQFASGSSESHNDVLREAREVLSQAKRDVRAAA